MSVERLKALPFFDDGDDVLTQWPLESKAAGHIHRRSVLQAARLGSCRRHNALKFRQKLGAFPLGDLDRGDHVNHDYSPCESNTGVSTRQKRTRNEPPRRQGAKKTGERRRTV